ncbi:MAG: hemolysin family protein [Lachnospiraceae bacterium]
MFLLLSSFFSSAETALITCNRIRIRTLAEEGNQRAITLEKVLEDQSKMLGAILIGNNIVNLSASSVATLLADKLLGSSGAAIATGLLTLLILIFGELSPKTMATIHAESMALKYARPIHILMVLFTPVIFVVNKLSRGFIRLMGTDPDEKNNTMTESELRTIVDVSHEDGVIESDERKMINNVVDFGDSRARDVMVPRIDMVFAQVDMSYEELLNIFKEERYTRLPVYEESIDDVIGIINMKDLLLYKEGTPFSIRNYLREPYYAYEFKRTSEIMHDMKLKKSSVTIVLDEYGTTAGLITFEDLIEEIVGDIRDEYDEDEVDEIRAVGENAYMISASAHLDEINEVLEIELESEEYDTLGGYMIERLDHLPKEGEQIENEDAVFTVEKVDKNRIDMVYVVLKEKETTEE